MEADILGIVAWLVLALSLVGGMAGVVFPALPGILLMLVGAGAHKYLLPQYLSWWTLALLAMGVVASWAIDFFGSAAGAKWGGATKYGLWGATIGGIAGLFFLPFGLVLGPLVGAFIGEFFNAAGSTVRHATKAGVGAGIGVAISIVLRSFLGLILAVWVVVDCLLSA